MAIPLSLRKRFIQQKLSKLLARHHKRKRGQRTFKESRARYPIAAQFSIHSLKRMLELYDLRQEANPKMPLWDGTRLISTGNSLGSSVAHDGTKDIAPNPNQWAPTVSAPKRARPHVFLHAAQSGYQQSRQMRFD